MKRFTVNIPKNLKVRLDELPQVNWTEVAKQGLLKKLKRLEKFEALDEMGDM